MTFKACIKFPNIICILYINIKAIVAVIEGNYIHHKPAFPT